MFRSKAIRVVTGGAHPVFLLLLAGFLCGLSGPLQAWELRPGIALGPEGYEEIGIIGDQADYGIHVPPNWNGVLLLYAHGGENYQPDTIYKNESRFSFRSEVWELLDQNGYARAQSAYGMDGIAPQSGIVETLRLKKHFIQNVGTPDRILLFGLSNGSTVVLKSTEEHPEDYDGTIALCLRGNWLSAQDEAAMAKRLFANVFGWPPQWGPSPSMAPENIDLDTVYAGLFAVGAIQFGPQGPRAAQLGKWEFIRLAMHKSPAFYYWPDPNHDPQSGATRFVTQVVQPLEDPQLHGTVMQNEDHVYTLNGWQDFDLADLEQYPLGTPTAGQYPAYPYGEGGLPAYFPDMYEDELAYLNALLPDGEDTAEELLEKVNDLATNVADGNVITADPEARAFLERWGNLSGKINRPVLTIGSRAEYVLLVENNREYRDLVEANHRERYLCQVYNNRFGHCSLAAGDTGCWCDDAAVLLGAVEFMDEWVRTKDQPADINAFMPEGTSLDDLLYPESVIFPPTGANPTGGVARVAYRP